MDEPWRRPCEKFRECMDPQPREKKKKEMEEMDKLIGSDVVRKQGKVKISGDYICVYANSQTLIWNAVDVISTSAE
jgi:hypothetical protein